MNSYNNETLRLEIHKMHLESTTGNMQSYLQATTGFAQAAIRGAFILNGAAAIAALTSTTLAKTAALHIITNGAKGAFFAVACSGLSYLSQRIYMAAAMYGCNKGYCSSFGLPIDKRYFFQKYWFGTIFLFAAFGMFAYSLYIFYTGLSLFPDFFNAATASCIK